MKSSVLKFMKNVSFHYWVARHSIGSLNYANSPSLFTEKVERAKTEKRVKLPPAISREEGLFYFRASLFMGSDFNAV